MRDNFFLTKRFLFSGDGKDETTLQTAQSNLAKTDIYNAIEFGLFYKVLPKKKTLHLKDDK